MTPGIEQVLQLTRYGHSYVALDRNNYMEFFPGLKAGPADIAHNILDETLNKPGVNPYVKNGKVTPGYEDDPTSCFELEQSRVKPIVKSVAAHAINEYGLENFGFIDMNDTVLTPELASNTLLKIETMGSSLKDELEAITFIAVEAVDEAIFESDEELTPEQKEAAAEAKIAAAESAVEIYTALSYLPARNFRVAILGSAVTNLVAQA